MDVTLWTNHWTGVAIVLGAILALRALERLVTRTILPPGPRGLPIIGNALQIPTNEPKWPTLVAWAERYNNELMHFSMFGTSVIVVNSRRAIHELLEKRGALYADRPRSVMGGELVGWNVFLPLNPYDDRCKHFRRILLSVMGPRQAEQLRIIQDRKARKFLVRLLDAPADVRTHIWWLSASTSMQITVGIDAETTEHPVMQLAIQTMHEFLASIAPGRFLVDLLPILKYVPGWLPGAGFEAQAMAWRKTMVRIRDEPYEQAKRDVVTGNTSPSMLSGLLRDNPDPSPETEDIYRHISATSIVASIDTIAAVAEWFFLAMTLYPDVQRKAQTELDNIVGAGRLPTFGDRANLPYVEALLKEVHRWNPVGPLGLQHKLMQDDVYEGFTLPANSIVVPNIWSLCHDSHYYPEPNVFKPERYLSGGNDDKLDPRSYVFGFGKRKCPGVYLADNLLFITIATTLAVFDISKVIDTDGRTIEPVITHVGEIIVSPGHFECRITPRSEEAAQLIMTAAGET